MGLDVKLISDYPLDEASGSLCADSFASNNGSATGTTVVSGKLGNARSFNGSPDIVVLANPANFAGLTALSISCWIYINTLPAVGQAPSLINKWATSDKEWDLGIVNNGVTSSLYCFLGASGGSVTSSTALSTGTWYHVVFVWTGTVATLYLNGSSIGTAALSPTLSNGTQPVQFAGFNVLGGAWYKGILDQVDIFNADLSSGEIASLYNSGSGLARSVPGAPASPSPANHATGVSTSPTIGWGAISGALTYQLQVSTVNTFVSTVYDNSAIATNSQAISGLSNNTPYYWRVRATNAWTTGAWSSTFDFTTVAISPPAAPTLSSPANGASDQALGVTLSWNSVAGALNYKLQVATDSGFTTTVYENDVLTTTSAAPGLSVSTRYYWRVAAANAGGFGSWSSTRWFDTTTNVPVATAQLWLEWQFNVNWSGDGSTFVDESDHLQTVEHIKRGREQALSASGNGFEPLGIGTASLVLLNYDGRYDAWNPSSTLYPNVAPGKYCNLKTVYNSVTYTVFSGTIDNIVPFDQDSTPKVRITLVDGVQFLQQNMKQTESSLGGSFHLSDALNSLLVAGSGGIYPTIWGTSITATTDSLYWWADGSSLHDQIHKLMEADGGWFYVANDGKATFIPYASLNSGTISATIDQSQVFKVIPLPQPWENLRNIVKVNSQYPALVSSVTLWELSQPIYLASGAAITIYPQFNGISHDTTGFGGFKLFQNSDGTGSDYTVQLSASSISVYATGGKLTLTNAGPNAGYVTAGHFIATEEQFTAMGAQQDNSSGSINGQRLLVLDSPWMQNVSLAQNLATALANYLSVPHPSPVITLENRYSLQFAYDVGALIRFTASQLYINGLFRILGLEHQQSQVSTQGIRTTFWLWPIAGDNMAILGGQIDTTVALSSHSYYGSANNFGATESHRRVVLSAGVIRKLRIMTSGAQDASGSLVITLLVNGAAPANPVTITIAAGSTPTGNKAADTTHAVTISDGDEVSWDFQNNATAASLTIISVTYEFVPSS